MDTGGGPPVVAMVTGAAGAGVSQLAALRRHGTCIPAPDLLSLTQTQSPGGPADADDSDERTISQCSGGHTPCGRRSGRLGDGETTDPAPARAAGASRSAAARHTAGGVPTTTAALAQTPAQPRRQVAGDRSRGASPAAQVVDVDRVERSVAPRCAAPRCATRRHSFVLTRVIRVVPEQRRERFLASEDDAADEDGAGWSFRDAGADAAVVAAAAEVCDAMLARGVKGGGRGKAAVTKAGQSEGGGGGRALGAAMGAEGDAESGGGAGCGAVAALRVVGDTQDGSLSRQCSVAGARGSWDSERGGSVEGAEVAIKREPSLRRSCAGGPP